MTLGLQVAVNSIEQKKQRTVLDEMGFCHKINENGKMVRYNAIWMFNGFLQEHGIDYDQNHSPGFKISTLRVIQVFFCATPLIILVHQMDLNTSFLNVMLEESIFVTPPPSS